MRAITAPVNLLVEGALPFLGALGLVVAGYVLWTRRYVYNDADVSRVVGWTVVGMSGMAVIFLWILSHQLVRGSAFHHAKFILVNNLVVRNLVGFLIGTYDARSRSYRRSIKQE